MREVWRAIPGFEGFYEASDAGRVRSVDRTIGAADGRTWLLPGVVLKPSTRKEGRRRVCLWVRHRSFDRYVAHLVALAFIGPRPPGMEVCHDNGRAGDDRLSNLYYGTPLQNAADKRRHGTHVEGEAHGQAKLTAGAVRHIRENPEGLTQRELAARFGVGQSQVSRVQNGLQWSHAA